MGVIPKQYCERFGGHYNTDIKRCVPDGRVSQFSKSYILTYVFLIMMVTISLSRIIVIITGVSAAPDEFRGGVIFGRFEWHHYYEGVGLLIIAAILSLLWKKSPDVTFILASLYGLSFGLIADELLYISESTISGHSDYWSMLYLIISVIIFVVLIITGKIASKTDIKGISSDE